MRSVNTTGIIIKKETLASFQSAVRFNELVLEDISPFPGYYDHFHIPVTEKEILPKFLFFVLKSFNPFNDDEFLRITSKIRASLDFEFDARLGQLYLYNELKTCIRIRVKDYNKVSELILGYQKEGIEFAKNSSVKSYESIIKIKKHFILHEISPGIFEHHKKPEVHYIEIPGHINWDTFELLTTSLKQNAEYKNFDAALAAIHTADGVMDMIRIYDKSCTVEKLQNLKEKYDREISRYL